jgi:GNAT superfamily N-acetyltransferase
MDDLVISNLKSFVEISGSLRGSRALYDPRGLWACDGGTGAAYENYALLADAPESDIEELISKGLGFFRKSGDSHIWPIFTGAPAIVRCVLEKRGARLDDTFFGMIAELPQRLSVTRGATHGAWVTGDAGAKDWADAVWYGFDSGTPAPESFVNFAENIAKCEEISLFSLMSAGSELVAATGLLCVRNGVAGIYYVSTRPEFRRKRLGIHVMSALMEKGFELGCRKSCLIATPEGKPLYLKCGFKETGQIDIMLYEGSASDNGEFLR